MTRNLLDFIIERIIVRGGLEPDFEWLSTNAKCYHSAGQVFGVGSSGTDVPISQTLIGREASNARLIELPTSAGVCKITRESPLVIYGFRKRISSIHELLRLQRQSRGHEIVNHFAWSLRIHEITDLFSRWMNSHAPASRLFPSVLYNWKQSDEMIRSERSIEISWINFRML